MNQNMLHQLIFPKLSFSNFRLQESERRLNKGRCSDCDSRVDTDSRFCTDCGASVQMSGILVIWPKARPSLIRRLQAELLDRLAPFSLAFIIAMPLTLVSLRYFFWLFAGVLFGWHLLRDCSPQRRSLGKWWKGLCVVTTTGQQLCNRRQAMFRRLPGALCQMGYVLGSASLFARFTHWERLSQTIAAPWPEIAYSSHFIPLLLLIPLVYDSISVASLLITPDARRCEDYLLGTQVILEEAYVRDQRACNYCEQLMAKKAVFCPHCGKANEIVVSDQSTN
ncbi:MAG: RDD family protein [Acidobacteria bacterium]|nr:RDD family protein [Acidobacteriota bacterium]